MIDISSYSCDIQAGRVDTWYEANCLPGEPGYVPRPTPDGVTTAAAEDEDDG